MTALTWNDPGTRVFEDGLDRGVLYPNMEAGVAWAGLASIDENVVGGEQTPLYYEGTKYLDIIGGEDFQATISAYAAPREFDACDGTISLAPGLYATQQPRVTFGLSYRTRIGNDIKGLKLGYKIHVVYNATASPSSKTNKTLTNVAAPDARSWTIDTVPPDRGSLLIKPTAHLIIDSRRSNPDALAMIEGLLYGTATTAPQLPSPTVFKNTLAV